MQSGFLGCACEWNHPTQHHHHHRHNIATRRATRPRHRRRRRRPSSDESITRRVLYVCAYIFCEWCRARANMHYAYMCSRQNAFTPSPSRALMLRARVCVSWPRDRQRFYMYTCVYICSATSARSMRTYIVYIYHSAPRVLRVLCGTRLHDLRADYCGVYVRRAHTYCFLRIL